MSLQSSFDENDKMCLHIFLHSEVFENYHATLLPEVSATLETSRDGF